MLVVYSVHTHIRIVSAFVLKSYSIRPNKCSQSGPITSAWQCWVHSPFDLMASVGFIAHLWHLFITLGVEGWSRELKVKSMMLFKVIYIYSLWEPSSVCCHFLQHLSTLWLRRYLQLMCLKNHAEFKLKTKVIIKKSQLSALQSIKLGIFYIQRGATFASLFLYLAPPG